MKIAIYNDWWSPDLVGGAERTALELSSDLASHFGVSNIRIFTLSNSNISREELQDGLQVSRLHSRTFRSEYALGFVKKFLEKLRVLLDWKLQRRVIDEILKFEPDVLILHNIDRLGLNFVVKFRAKSAIPLVRIQHDLGDTCIFRTRTRKLSKLNCFETCSACKLKEMHYRNQSKEYDVMIAVSQFVESTLHRLRFYPKVSTFAYPAFEGSDFQGERFFFDESSILRLGFLGRMVPEKGIELVLRSMALLNANGTRQVSLTVCGTGSGRYLKKLANLALELDVDLSYLGSSESPYELLAGKIDAVVVPSSWQEPLGRVPMECVSRGIPCFVSEIGGLVEAGNWVGGPIVFFNPSDVMDLTRKISASLDFGIEILKPPTSTKSLNATIIQACQDLDRKSASS